ncbi:MotA/TolQ/ExbB proton channel family protein [Thalassolituus marinus]|uniref:MotA/TolQ/ExbB proton channel family protein n=2 Tax=Thalassolituus marinus TaxID=671053 RepID=A0ABS7ZPQ4_9GAMM|nr:MotA/TolQ/ExbB proton channel family protein [Thalassolituus marinus]
MQAALLTVAREIPQQQERDDQLFLQLQHNRIQLERRLTAIAITASVSPLLGLLGTVSGMIETFRMMTLFGSGNPEVVSGGIAQALITTELGLVVAIPALVIHSLLSRRARAYYQQLENFALLLSKADNNSNDEKQINPRQEALSA